MLHRFIEATKPMQQRPEQPMRRSKPARSRQHTAKRNTSLLKGTLLGKDFSEFNMCSQ